MALLSFSNLTFAKGFVNLSVITRAIVYVGLLAIFDLSHKMIFCINVFSLIGFAARAVASWLSSRILIGLLAVPGLNSFSSLLSHTASRAAEQSAIYSAYVVDKATTGCFLFIHMIAPLARVNTWPEVECDWIPRHWSPIVDSYIYHVEVVVVIIIMSGHALKCSKKGIQLFFILKFL